MLREDYVSFEVAKLLKEKGFDEPTFWFYVGDGTKYLAHKTLNGDWYRRPTLQMAMKWLREVHSLYVDISFNRFNKTYHFNIVQYYQYDNKNKPYIEQTFYVLDNMFDSYEKAIESAIKYCLENLI